MKLFRMRRSCRGNTYVAEHLTIKNRPGVRNRLILPADDHYALEAWERMRDGGVRCEPSSVALARIVPHLLNLVAHVAR